ncbi:MAG: leucyl/phenylalanyl-tRNA--protein transferase, partial [Alphaproteobacteria bacterium]
MADPTKTPPLSQSRITAQILLKAYGCGIFPMAESARDAALYWIDPQERGILPLEKFHLARRLRRTVRHTDFQVTVDTAFARVVEECAVPRPGRPSTWINSRIARLCEDLHEMGSGHSVEVWDGKELVGGLYGISLKGAFFGESMFSTARDASKIALVHLVARLIAGGYVLLDTQFITDHLKQFGAIEISRATYHQKLERALECQGNFFKIGAEPLVGEVLQSL